MRLLGRALSVLAATAIAGTAALAADWIEYKSTKYGFSVSVPVPPREHNSTLRTVEVHIFTVGDETAFCTVQVSDYPDPIDDAELARTRDVYLLRMSGTMTTSLRRTLSRGEEKLPAIEFDFSGPTMFVRTIIAIDGKRVYQVSSGIPLDAPKDGMERCVRSFKLLPKT